MRSASTTPVPSVRAIHPAASRFLLLGALSACAVIGSLAAAPISVVPPPTDGSKLIPQVKPATKSDLELRPGSLMLVTDAPTGQRYWVFNYTIVNKSGKTRRFSPRFDLLMGGGEILSGGSDVPAEVSRRLQRAVAKPEAIDQFQIMGEILEGEANAREGFVVWPAKGDSKEVTLFVTGVSAAFDRVKDPATGKETLVRRTWTRTYAVPGTADPRVSSEATFDPLKDAWIMR